MTPDLAALVAKLRDAPTLQASERNPIAGPMVLIEPNMRKALLANIESLVLGTVRDHAIDMLAKVLGVDADKARAVEYYARLASEKIKSLAAHQVALIETLHIEQDRSDRYLERAESLAAENAQLAEGWRVDAERYAKNADHWRERAERAEAERDALAKDAEYYKWRLHEIIPLFQEARDALPAITLASAKLRNIDLSLGDRMDRAGTRTRADFDAATHPAAPR